MVSTLRELNRGEVDISRGATVGVVCFVYLQSCIVYSIPLGLHYMLLGVVWVVRSGLARSGLARRGLALIEACLVIVGWIIHVRVLGRHLRHQVLVLECQVTLAVLQVHFILWQTVERVLLR